MSELPEGVAPADPPAPRPSAAGLVVRHGPDGWRVLLGARSKRSRFMPGHLAFPGGGLDPADRPDEPGAFARAVARELEEETGFRRAADDWIPAGERTTPPLFPVRFRTLFYVADAGDWTPPAAPPSPDELETLEFLDPRRVLDAWAQGGPPLPPPSVPLLRTLAAAPADVDLGALAGRLAATNAEEDRTPRIEFVPGLWMTPVRTATLPPASHTNVWLPGGGARFAIVDPGCREADARAHLLRTIERRRAAGGEPAAVLVTHEHGDHAGGAWWMARTLGVPLHGRPEALAAAERMADDAGAPETVEVADGDVLDLDGCRLEALHTPGHAPGHVAWWNAEGRWLLAGDLLSGMSTILVLPGSGDMDAYLASLERVRALKPRRLLPAHGPPLPGKALAKLIAHRLERERKVLDALPPDEAGAPLARIARAAYPELPDAPAFLVESQTHAHLVRLERTGRARKLDGGDGASEDRMPRGTDRWRRTGGVAAELERRLRDALAPAQLDIRDDSAKHAGHAGATSGGGHFVVRVVSAAFEGLPLIDRHRKVHDAVADLFGAQVHALKLDTRAPSEVD